MTNIALLPGDGVGTEILEGPVAFLQRLAAEGEPITITGPILSGRHPGVGSLVADQATSTASIPTQAAPAKAAEAHGLHPPESSPQDEEEPVRQQQQQQQQQQAVAGSRGQATPSGGAGC